MKKQTAIKIILWLLVIATAVGIFCFSGENSDRSNETSGRFIRFVLGLFPSFRALPVFNQDNVVESVMYVARKCAHFCIYAVLGFWIVFLTKQYRNDALIGISVGSSFLYALTDEFHQRFVPGRYGCMRDVFIDTGGAFTGACVALIIIIIWNKLRSSKQRGM